MNKIMRIGIGCLLALIALTSHATPSIQEFNSGSLVTIRDSQKGHPFILVVWSLECEFCQASLTALSAKRRTNKKLRVVTISTDSYLDKNAMHLMNKRLASLDLRANAWAFGGAPPEQLRYVIDQKWRGEMPRSYWFDAKGASVARSGVITAAAIDRFLEVREVR